MYFFYGLILLMLITALGILAVPFFMNRTAKKRHFYRDYSLVVLFILLVTLGLYTLFGNYSALKQWLGVGEKHYQLLEEVNQLGGIDGMIIRVKQKISENPQDSQGWFVLGKLYLAKQDYTSAALAFNKARKLNPQNDEYQKYYALAVQQLK